MTSPVMTSSPLRILTVANVPPDPNSGAAGTVFHTNVALRELGHDVDEIWADRLGPRRIRHGNLHSLIEQPRAYRREVLKATSEKTYDAVMISQPQGYLAAKALKKQRFPGAVINRSHGLELRVDAVLPQWHQKLGVPESRRPWLTKITRRFLQRQWAEAVRWFDGVVLPSFDDRDFLTERFQLTPEQAVTIHHGVPDVFLNTPVPAMTVQRRRRLLYIGQHSFIKGPDILIDILNDVITADSTLSMTWVTAASAHSEIRSRLQPQVRDHVTLKEWVPQEQLLPLLDSHGIFVFPSFFEGAGKACAEALSRGLCVVASDTGGMKDHLGTVMPNGLCGVGDVGAFSKAILLASRSGLPAQTRERIVRHAQTLTWTACAQQLTRYFETFFVEKRLP